MGSPVLDKSTPRRGTLSKLGRLLSVNKGNKQQASGAPVPVPVPVPQSSSQSNSQSQIELRTANSPPSVPLSPRRSPSPKRSLSPTTSLPSPEANPESLDTVILDQKLAAASLEDGSSANGTLSTSNDSISRSRHTSSTSLSSSGASRKTSSTNSGRRGRHNTSTHSTTHSTTHSRSTSPSPVRVVSRGSDGSEAATLVESSIGGSHPVLITSNASSASLMRAASVKRARGGSVSTGSSAPGSGSGSVSGSGSGVTAGSSSTAVPNGSTLTLKEMAMARFVMNEDGSHEHHLRNIKRQEKVSQMVKDLLGAKRLRNQAVSAIPNILSSTNLAQLDKKAQETVDAVNSTVKGHNLPPTLFSSLLGQVKDGEIMQYTHREGFQQPQNPVSVKPEGEEKLESFFERYGTCQEVVGRGSFGVVRIAHKKLVGEAEKERLFAVKEFKKKPTESEKRYSKRLTTEFCISSSLKHPGIIATYDLLRDAKGDYCEVMEYCSGGDLYSLIITAGKLDQVEADCFFKQLMRVVHYMHEMGVTHRDLKPENILLTHDGRLKITDFGNAECFRMAWEDEEQPTHGICGSSPYIAPEEYTEKEFEARPLDIWACGVIYMAMRTGRQLWKVATLEDEFYAAYVAKRNGSKGYEPIEMLKNSRCRNVVYSILDPNPKTRLSSKQVLQSEWLRGINCCKQPMKPKLTPA